MEKHYNTKWLSSLYRGLLLSVSLLLVSGMAMAQLDGTYTINSASATSGTNFKSFADLASALKSNGVKGAVTINVVASSGPYSESVSFEPASGASATNTITINGNGETITTTSSTEVIDMYGADFMTFKNLKINAAGTGNNTKCVLMRNNADNNTFDGCEMIVSRYRGTSNSTAYVAFSGSTSSARSTGYHGSDNTFSNNKMWSGSTSNSTGPYYGIIQYYNYAKGNNKFEKNDMMHVYYYWMYNYYSSGYKVIGNKFHKQRNGANYAYITYAYYGNSRTTAEQIQLNDNEYYDLTCNYVYGMYSYRCQGSSAKPFQMSGNKCYNNDGLYVYGPRPYYANTYEANNNEVYGNAADYYLYGMYPYYSSNGECKGNKITNNDAGYYVYGMYCYFASNVNIDANTISDNSGGYGVYGFYHYYMTGSLINNTYFNNTGDYYNYAFLGGYCQGSLDVCHNTIVLDDDVDYYSYAFYAYHYYAFTNMNYKNNIVVISGKAGYYNYAMYSPYNYKDMNWENNDFYITSPSTNYYYTSSQHTTLANFNNSVGNNTNISVDPKFKNLAASDITPTNPVIANYGQPGYADVDFAGTTRTKCGPDIGAFEFTIDHNASDLVFTGAKECGGYSEAIKFTFNNGSTVDLEDARVYYTEIHVDETIDLVKASSSADYTFDAVPEFHEPGVNTIEVGLACDDNTANNTLTTTITITPAPHSFELSEGTNFPGYFNAGSMGNPDVTVPGKKIEYNVENPTKYGNSAYGTDWSAAIVAMTEGGTDVSSDANLTAPGSAKGILDFDPSATLADSMVWLGLTVTDNNTGCDSTFGRWVYVPHTPAVDWIAPDGCDGDVVAFVNKTKQEKGAIEYSWDFGDPNSGTENNMSTISDPVHKFSTYGTYTITMTAWNFDYPKFTYTKTAQVSISPVPTVAYRVNNACFGDAITFVNMTTLPSGITGTIDYTWNFGNGATSKKKDESYKYPAPGGYKVTLTASLKGCATSLTKNANQFAKPVADFSVSGKCNLEEIEFMNASTIAIGNTGYNWTFNDGSVSNLSNPTHAFATPGSHTVKLKAVSEFGCIDETERTFTLNESPKADFSYTDACSETAVEFTREGSLPSGANSIFEWDFDGEKVSTKENDKHKFGTVGVKNVSLKVSSDNGCSDMISKEFVVKLQAKADFVANNVCVGDEVVFTNNSEVAAGNLDYEWRFGGANAAGVSTSTNTSPRHNYKLGDESVTESFRVTLLALVPGGCSDSIAKTVTVNAKSDASFTATTNWRNLVISNQATTDGQSNQFNWTFGDGGRSNDVTPTYKYSVDKDMFEVCLAIINNAGCISKHCEEVELDINSSSVNDIAANSVFNVYPNPNTGIFNVKVLDPQNDLNIVIMDATGKTIKTVNTDASGVYNVDMTDVAAGVYMVQVINGNTSAMQRVTIAN